MPLLILFVFQFNTYIYIIIHFAWLFPHLHINNRWCEQANANRIYTISFYKYNICDLWFACALAILLMLGNAGTHTHKHTNMHTTVGIQVRRIVKRDRGAGGERESVYISTIPFKVQQKKYIYITTASQFRFPNLN